MGGNTMVAQAVPHHTSWRWGASLVHYGPGMARAAGVLIIGLCMLCLSGVSMGYAQGSHPSTGEHPILTGRLVAVGIPGAGALSPVGTFHPGGPINDKPDFAAFTRPGAVLDPTRLLVASTSNFGAPLAQPSAPPGAILSLDPRITTPLVVPATFARGDGQATALEDCVQLLTANSPAFVNKLVNPQ